MNRAKSLAPTAVRFWLSYFDHLEKFFFQVRSPTNLAVSRMVFFTAITFFPADSFHFNELTGDFWMPVGVFRLTPFLSPPFSIPEFAYNLWRISLVFCALGFFSRIFMPMAFCLSLFFFGYGNNFGLVVGNYGVVVITQLILTMSQSADALSFDAFLKRKLGRARKLEMSWEYTWPLSLIQVLFAILWFGAGYQKLAQSGFHWVGSDYLLTTLWKQSPALAQILLPYKVYLNMIAGFVIAVELGLPFLLFSKLRWCMIALITFFIVVNYLTLKVLFFPWLTLLPFFIDWERQVSFLLRPPAK